MKRIFSRSSRRFSHACLLTVAVAIVFVSCSGSALAAPYTWAGVSGAIWDLSSTNWSGATGNPWDGTNGPTNIATFTQTGSNSAVVSGLVTTNGITFSPTAGGTLTLSGGTIALAGGTSAQILNLLSTGSTGVTAASTLTIASTITSTTNFFIGGFGTTILSGSNSLSGTVTIGSGTSQVLNPTVRLASSNALDGASAVVLVAGGTNSSVGQTLELANGVTITGKQLLYSGANRASLLLSSGTATWNGNVGSSIAAYANGSLLTFGTGTDTTFNGSMRGTGTGAINSALLQINKTDPGTWIINSTSNSFTLTPSISSGVVSISQIANSGVNSPIGSGTAIALGNTSSGTPGNWGYLRFTGSAGGSSNRAIVLYNGTVGGSGGIDSAVVGQTLTLSGNVTVSNTASTPTFVLTGSGNGVYSGNITPSSSNSLILQKAGSGTWTLSGSNAHTGGTQINGGVLALGSTSALSTTGSITFGGGALQYGINNQQDYSGRIVGSGSAVSVDTNGQNVTFASSLAASNTGGLTKTGLGTLTLSASNAYLGTTTVNGGTLALGNLYALTTTIPTVVVNGGALDLAGNALTLTSLSGTSAAGSITSSVAGVLALTATSSGNTTYAGGINNGSATISLTKTGAGTLTLSGSSSYTGGTLINGGVLSVGNANALGTSGSITFGGGTLQYAAGNAVDYSSRILGSGSVVRIDTNGQSVTFASQIASSNAGGFTKSGSGLLTLSGTGAYTAGAVTLDGGTTSIAPGAGNSALFAALKVATLNSTNATLSIDSGSVTFTPPSSNYFAVGDANTTATVGTVNVTGGATTIDISNANSRMMIGNKATGVMNVTGGSLTVAGGNAIYVGGDAQWAASNANGSLTISGGTMAITGAGSFFLGTSGSTGNTNTGIAGTLNLNGGELQTIRAITTGTNTTSTVNFNGGMLTPLASNASFMTGLTAANVQSGGARINTNGYDVTIGQALVAGTSTGGGLTKSGAGTLTLTGASTYTGATTISGGTLALSGGNNRLGTSSALAFTGGTVGLNGISQTVTSLTVSDSTSAAVIGMSTGASTLSVVNPITLGGGSGTSTLLLQPQVASGTGNTLTLSAGAGITVNTGGDLRFGVLGITSSGTVTNPDKAAVATLNASNPVTVNGGSFTLDKMVLATGSTSSASGIASTIGAFTMSSGRFFIDNTYAIDRRITFGGLVNVTGGTMSIAQNAAQDMALGLQASGTNVLNPASFDRNMGVAFYSGSSTLSTSVPLGRVFTRASGTYTITSSATGGNIGTLYINDGSTTPGVGSTVQLGSNLTLVAGGGTRDGLPTITGYSLVPEVGGRADLGIDANGYTLDLSGNSAVWQPNSTTQSGTAVQAYWQLSSSSGTGRFIANGFNFVYSSGSANAYTSVGPNVILESRAGNGRDNNLGSGTFSTTSIFRYSGTATAASPSTLTSATSIGDLEVTGVGALKILSLAGGAQNLRVSSGILDGGSNSIAFAGSATISGGTVQTGTITAAGGYAVQAGSVSAVLAGGVALAKSSSGTATLSGANQFTGGVTVSDGVLNLGNALALGAAGGNLAMNGGTVDLRGYGITVGDLSGSSTGTITSSSNTTATLTVGGANSTRFDGTLANSAGTLNFVKQGAGSLTLGGANTFTGTTSISAGTLVLDNALALQNSTFDTAGIASLSFGTLTAASFGGLTGSGNIDLTALSGGLTVGGGNRSSTYGGVLSGAGGLTKTGTGTFILTGSQAYAGATTISQGTLQVGTNGTTGWISAGSVTNNGALAFSRSDTVTFSGNISGSGSVTQSGGGVLTLSGSNGYAGGTLVTGTGMLQVASSAALGTGTITLQTSQTSYPTVLNLTSGMTLANPIVLAQNAGNRNNIQTAGVTTFSGPITITGTGYSTDVISGGTSSGMLTTVAGNLTAVSSFTGNISLRGNILVSGTINMPLANLDLNSGGTTTVSSTGNVWTFTQFQATSNVLRVGAENALPTNARVEFSGNATGGGLDLNGFNQSIAGFNSSSGTIPAPLARIFNNGAANSTLTLAGLGSDRNANIALADGTGGGTLALVMNSVGRTQTLASATSSYSGGTTILAGTLAQGAANALGSTGGALAVNGGTLDLRGFGLSVGLLSGSAGGVITSGTAGAVTFTASSASSSTFGGVIQDGSGTVGFTKSGAGTLALTGVNTFSGATTITGGALSISGTGNLPNTSGFNLSSGGGLTYTGGADSFGKSITVTGGTGSVTNAGAGVLTLAGTLSKNGTVLRLAGGQFNVTGQIVGANANSDLLVDGATVTLSNTNSYNGPTFVQNAGTLILGVADAIPSNSAVSLAGSTLTVAGYTDAIGSLSTSGNSTINVSIDGGSAGGLSMGDLSFGGGTNTLAVTMTNPTAGIYNLLTYSGNKTGSFTATGVSPNYTLLTGGASNSAIALQRKADLGTVTASTADAVIITGGSTAIGYTVQNLTPSGGATLSFASTNVSNVFGASSGTALANSTSGTITGLFFTGTAVGSNQPGSFTVQDLAALTTTGTGSVSVTVLDHATPAFVGVAPTATNLLLDFGTVDQSAGLQSVGYSLTNLASTFGDSLTAGLALTGFAHDSGDTLFDTGLSTFADLLASGTNGYTASFTPSTVGTFSEVFRLSFSDNQSIAGAAQRRDLTVTMNVVVVPEPGALALAGVGLAIAAWGWSRRKSRA